MAGVVFVPYSAHGHVNPMLAVAAELVGRGVPVRLVAGARFARRITRTGAVAVVPEIDHDVRVPARWHPADLLDRTRLWTRRRAAWRLATAACSATLHADPPSLVVADPMAPWAGRLARRLGIPVVNFWTTHASSPRGAGLALVNSLPELQPKPRRFGTGFHFVGPLVAPPHSADLAWLPEDGRRVLLVSPGTVFTRGVEFFTGVLREFADSSWLVLVATGHTPVAALGSLPDNVIARPWLPQRALLSRVTAFVTHGGMNSVQEALLDGVPMLLTPRSREQRLTTSAVVRLGLGRRANGPLQQDVEALVADEDVRAALNRMRIRTRQRRGAELAADQLVRHPDSAC